MAGVPDRIEVVDDETAAVLRGKTGAERLAMAFAMFESARRMLLSHLAAEHPDWSIEQVTREAARRLSHGAV
jgi:Rv0078B-related antitoxin